MRRRDRPQSIAAALLGAALLFAGCAGGRDAAPDASAPPIPPGDRWYTLDDQRLCESIRQALLADDAVSGLTSAIGIDADAGRVRLVGTVTTAAAKAAAGRCARWLAGPDQVENDIRIRTAPPPK
jgi:osmotically-inducible protein OsmY